jgi:hypothetical protein
MLSFSYIYNICRLIEAKRPRRRPARGTSNEGADARKGTRLSQIVTANRLADGVVVFPDAGGDWAEDFGRAAVHADAAAVEAALALAGEAVARSLVVDPYAVEVELRNGHYAPKALREAIRASGPTVRRDLGKQAQGLAPVFALNASVESPHVSL